MLPVKVWPCVTTSPLDEYQTSISTQRAGGSAARPFRAVIIISEELSEHGDRAYPWYKLWGTLHPRADSREDKYYGSLIDH